jgi:hypothetical protein
MKAASVGPQHFRLRDSQGLQVVHALIHRAAAQNSDARYLLELDVHTAVLDCGNNAHAKHAYGSCVLALHAPPCAASSVMRARSAAPTQGTAASQWPSFSVLVLPSLVMKPASANNCRRGLTTPLA